jgi:hypothetical protein
MSTKVSHTTEILDVPGMKFRVDFDDPKERIQAYIDGYAKPIRLEGHDEVSVRALVPQLLMRWTVLLTWPTGNR